MFSVDLTFCGDLPRFLRRSLRANMPRGTSGPMTVRRLLGEKTAVKDIIEACGIPHNEVDLIVAVDDQGAPIEALGLAAPVEQPLALTTYPVPAPAMVLPEAPRLQPRGCQRFVADCHLMALARHLRLLGWDTVCEADDQRLLEIMAGQQRALLTRDRRLLMHSIVHAGYCPRSDDPEEQAREVLRRFELTGQEAVPLSRCLRCNGTLQETPKESVLDELTAEPRTLQYYNEFLRCDDCGQVYWRGSHYDKLRARIARLG